MTALLRRIAGVVRKELTELVRQPALVGTLVVGPLAILLLFGAGVRPTDPAVRSIFVAPDGDEAIADLVRDYAELQSERLTIEDVTTSEEEAVATLRDGDVDLVVIFPGDPEEALLRQERSQIRVLHRFIDPLEAQAIRLFTRTAVDDINDVILREAIGEVQVAASAAVQVLDDLEAVDPELRDAIGADLAELRGEDPEAASRATIEDLEALIETDASLIAAPLDGEAESVGGRVTTSQFYAPAVVALILQHLTLTFIALARSRERELGTVELLAVSPLRPVERTVGQAIAFVGFGMALAAALLAAVVVLLGAPLRAGAGPVAVVVLLELLASIGVGLLLARLARTTQMVVQCSMLLLLLSVFFGGLLLSPQRLLEWARPIGSVLPMSHALQLLRDSMLRGEALSPGPLIALGGMAAGLFAVSILATSREQRRG